VVASRGSSKLNLLSGDGRGGLGEAEQIELPGAVTAMTVGEINRRDGLDDLVVGVAGARGAKAMVFEGPEGALRAEPEVFDMPAEATSLALGQLDESYEIDLAIAAGKELMIVHGRDRRLSLDDIRRAEVRPASVSERYFASGIRLLALGDFVGDDLTEIAVLTRSGSLNLLNVNTLRVRRVERHSWPLASGLVCGRLSSAPVDNLIVIGPQEQRLIIVTASRLAEVGRDESAGVVTSLDATGELAAVTLMRLNGDALGDMILLRSGHAAPVVIKTQPQAVFSVTNTNDSGTGSLSNAIINANGNPGADMIAFNIAGAGVQTIKPLSPLPVITEAVTIDGTTQPGFADTPIIELDGSSAGTSADGLRLRGGNSAVRGLAVNRFKAAGIRSDARASNLIEGNFIGTDTNGVLDQGNVIGVIISGSSNNKVGGTVAAARNLISGNDETGLEIADDVGPANGNSVEGNFVGTNVQGAAVLSNRLYGVYVADVSNNIIGGTTAGTRNLISGNPFDVALIGSRATGNLLQGNLIGTNASGTARIWSGPGGVSILSSVDTTIGGTTSQARNIISGCGCGINFNGARGTMVQGNFIGTDITGTAAVPNTFEGVYAFFSGNNTIGGAVAGARNVISGNGAGIQMFGDRSTGNQIQGNYIGTDLSGARALGNGTGIVVTDAPGNVIGGASAETRNVISGNRGHGVGIGVVVQSKIGGTGTLVQGNYLGTDASGNDPLGNGRDGIFVENESFIHTIRGNRIAFNKRNGVTIPNEGAGVNPGVRILMAENLIASNEALGIDLGTPGVTPNDDKDADGGANEQQNFPVLAPAALISPAASVTVSGAFNSTPNAAFTLEFFFGSNCPQQGSQIIGAIPVLLGSVQVTTDSNGNAPFSFTFEIPGGASGGWVNCTATSATGNTSEISECIAVGTLPSPGPRITAITRSGKKLFVDGQMFDSNAKILLNGSQQKTKYESATRVIGKKAGKKIKPGDRVQVRNSDGTLSNEVTYSPP
ncbi:MAG: hypothetical protein AB1631_14470, partial [Acidobacteriota bacterium]